MSVLIVDIGSSSTRAMLFDDDANPIPNVTVQQQYQFNYGKHGEATIDADNLRTIVEDCISEVLQHADNMIQAVGVSTFVTSLVGVDKQGNALTPLMTYADTRSGTVVDELRDKLGHEAAHSNTGCRIHSTYNTAKLYWFKQQSPDVFASVSRWMDIGSYLYLQWFGDMRTSFSAASWTGLLNREQLAWDATWLDLLGVDAAQFAPLSDFDNVFTGLQAPYKKKWKSLANVPFYLPVGDGAGANIGSGAVDKNYAAISVGSTSAMRYITDAENPPVPEGLWGYRVTANQHLIGGATTEGGTVFAWAKETLSLTQADIDAVASLPPDGHGLTVLPLFGGERSPNWQWDASATLHGMRLSTSKSEILQALLESVALRLAAIADMLLDDSVQIMASGGAIASSTVWAQMICDAMNCPLAIVEGETSARGVAIMLLSHLHNKRWSDYPPHISQTLMPRPEVVTAYQQARERQRNLYNKLYG